MTKSIEEILSPKPQVRPQIYAYSIDDKAHAGLLKVGQTTRDVKQRIAEQLKQRLLRTIVLNLRRMLLEMTVRSSVTMK